MHDKIMNKDILQNVDTMLKWGKFQKKSPPSSPRKKFKQRPVNMSDMNLQELGNVYKNVQRAVHAQNLLYPVLCDRKCKEDKKKQQLYEKYVLAKKNLKDAPQELNVAEKNFHVINKGGVWYANHMEKKHLKVLSAVVKVYRDKMAKETTNIKALLTAYKTHKTYTKQLDSLKKNVTPIQEQANNAQKHVEKKTNINERLTFYYQEQIKYINWAISFFKYIYWILLFFFIFFVLILQRKIFRTQILLVTLFFVVFPFLLNPLIYYIYSKTAQTDITIIK